MMLLVYKNTLLENVLQKFRSKYSFQHSKNEGRNIQSHQSMTNRWGNNGTVSGFTFTLLYFYFYLIKRHVLLGRKAITNLDSILKSRGIALATKVCLVKAMLFPVVTYGCKSRTIKKAEC